MAVSKWFDRTVAKRRKPGTPTIDRATGKFAQPDDTHIDSTINVHVSKPRPAEAVPGGAHLEVGDFIVHAEATHNLQPGEILEFWGWQHRVVVELNRYDALSGVVNHGRRSYLVRRLEAVEA